MGRREPGIAEFRHLVPKLLEMIKRESGLRHAELYRQLGEAMHMTPDAVKRNWLRWRAVTDEVNDKGRLAHSASLKRLVDAADAQGWLGGAYLSQCVPLLRHLHDRDERREEDRIRTVQRRVAGIRPHVRALIRERKSTAFDDVTWLSRMYEAVGDEIARELRRRLLAGVEDPDKPPADLCDELLAGTLHRKIREVLDVGVGPVAELERQVRQMESKVRADFDAMMEHDSVE